MAFKLGSANENYLRVDSSGVSEPTTLANTTMLGSSGQSVLTISTVITSLPNEAICLGTPAISSGTNTVTYNTTSVGRVWVLGSNVFIHNSLPNAGGASGEIYYDPGAGNVLKYVP